MSGELHELLTATHRKSKIHKLTAHGIHGELFTELFTALKSDLLTQRDTKSDKGTKRDKG